MPGLIVHSGMTMTCPHGGTVTVVPSDPLGPKVNGSPVATAADQIVVVGCPAQPTPCVKVQWANVSTVLVNGSPVLTQSTPPAGPTPGGGVCAGSAAPGPPLISAMQLLVTGR
jgi:hypothetical protein